MQELTFETESPTPVKVRVIYEGKPYVIRIAISVMGVQATGGTTPDGKPEFNVDATPVISVRDA